MCLKPCSTTSNKLVLQLRVREPHLSLFMDSIRIFQLISGTFAYSRGVPFIRLPRATRQINCMMKVLARPRKTLKFKAEARFVSEKSRMDEKKSENWLNCCGSLYADFNSNYFMRSAREPRSVRCDITSIFFFSSPLCGDSQPR
jgi:hypothetical protein